jgi:prepilin-type N-terminal cleavage/methylation domain-containing protein
MECGDLMLSGGAKKFLPLPEGQSRSEGERKLKSTRWQNSTERAFTLVELMIVIVLIGIVSALIIPEMRGGFEDALLRSTSRDLVNAIGIASSRAVSLNQLHRIRLDPGTGRYVIEKRVRETMNGDQFSPLKDVSEAEGKLDTRISIQMHSLEDSQGTASVSNEEAAPRPALETISFYSDGTADDVELMLRDRQGFRLALRINPITSRVKILDLGRE